MASTDTWSTTDLTCPECRAKEVRYTTLQLRGADEGSTMFYFCPGCSARWVAALHRVHCSAADPENQVE